MIPTGGAGVTLIEDTVPETIVLSLGNGFDNAGHDRRANLKRHLDGMNEHFEWQCRTHKTEFPATRAREPAEVADKITVGSFTILTLTTLPRCGQGAGAATFESARPPLRSAAFAPRGIVPVIIEQAERMLAAYRLLSIQCSKCSSG